MSITYGNTSLSMPSTPSEVGDYIKKRLGYPVNNIEVTDDQVNDRMTDALQFFRDYNDDGTEHVYLPYTLTQEDLDNNYLTTDGSVFEVIRVLSPNKIDKNILTDITYQLRHNFNFSDIFYSAYTGGSLEYYTLFKQKIEEIIDTFTPEPNVRFNRFTNTIHVEEQLSRRFSVGDILVFEAYVIIDPNEFGGVLSDRRFLNLATAYTKRQWAENLIKFQEITLFAGVKMNGAQMYQMADTEIQRAEDEIKTTARPAMDFIG